MGLRAASICLSAIAGLLLCGCAQYRIENDVARTEALVPPQRLMIVHTVNTDFDQSIADLVESRLQAGLRSCGVASIVQRVGTRSLSDPTRLARSSVGFKADYLLRLGGFETINGLVYEEYFAAILNAAPTIRLIQSTSPGTELVDYAGTEFWKATVSVTVRPPFSNLSSIAPGVVDLILQRMLKDGIVHHCPEPFPAMPVG